MTKMVNFNLFRGLGIHNHHQNRNKCLESLGCSCVEIGHFLVGKLKRRNLFFGLVFLFHADSSRRSYITEEIKKIGKGNISAQILTFRELCVATQNFNPNSLLGEGGFGRVYKGKLERTNQVSFLIIYGSINIYVMVDAVLPDPVKFGVSPHPTRVIHGTSRPGIILGVPNQWMM